MKKKRKDHKKAQKAHKRLQNINVKPKTKKDFEEMRAILSGIQKRTLNQDETLITIMKSAKRDLAETYP